ncbi:MGMT family protein [Glycomyces niveus]|uniref:MGMT family protein n=1 Tax=Glycomyces niveus TaxID=2820287 RepID=A0ABS3UB38_9ACTN|nr:MGMT family protein [Glycomyces sp. NEAU-S30]MBO3735466.1 MGMT family protein [Glycomyces sp. NEAU-S30]
MLQPHELSPATLARLSATFPFKFTNADEAVNGILDELQKLQSIAPGSPAPRPSTGAKAASSTFGALYEFIANGDFTAGDELRWERPSLRETHIAHVDANGCIVTEDGEAHAYPTNALARIAPGQQPHPWEAFVHSASGKTIGDWREVYRRRNHAELAPSGEDGRTLSWTEMIATVLERMPDGTWTTYGDLARLTGHHQREIGGHIARAHDLKNAWRVLLAEGKVSPNFDWPGEDLGDPHALLRKEGVRFSPSLVADRTQRLHVEDLRKLLTQ